MVAAAIAAHNAAQKDDPFSGSRRPTYRKRKSARRASSAAVLEDIAELLPAPSTWKWDIHIQKLSHKGKWEEKHVVVTEDKVFVGSGGRVLESIPLDEVSTVKAVTPRDPKTTTAEVGKWALHRSGSFPSLRAEQMANASNGWKSTKLLKAVSSRDLRHAEKDTARGDGDLCFEIETFETGEQLGRTYVFMCETSQQRTDLIAFLQAASAEAVKRSRHKSRLLRWQLKLRAIYESFPLQVSVAVLIVAAFVIQVWESETFPEEGTAARTIIDTSDVLLTLIFALELGLNLLSHLVVPFFLNPWNVFDLVIVSVSIVSLVLSSVPGLGALRLMRTFRVLRLFGRLDSFRRIVSALGAALLPVANAFVVVMLMVSVFAIMGVFLFRHKAPHYFRSFSVSFFTMFTISTVDGWVDVVYDAAPGTLDLGKLYFIAYILVVVWTLLPVVVAVLLDKFTEVMAKDKDRMRRARLPAFKPVTSSVLDPILMTLTDFESDDNLTQRIRLLYEALDAEGTGSLTYGGISEALRTLRLSRNVKISEEDFQELTDHGRLCDAQGGLSAESFEFVVRGELRDYLQRELAGELLKCEEHSMSAPILSSLKLLLLRDAPPDPLPAPSLSSSSPDHVSPIAALASPRPALASPRPAPDPRPDPDPSLRSRVQQSPAPHGPRAEARNSEGDVGGRAALVEQEEETTLPGQVPQKDAPATIAVQPVRTGPTLTGSQDNTPAGQGTGGDVAELARAVSRMEGLLVRVLEGQERLQSNQQRLDLRLTAVQGDVSKLTLSQAALADSVGSMSAGGAGGLCDVCQDEKAKSTVGRARVCELCASLLTDGQI